ncbi:hypothetical protein BJX68DRAFT_230033 [Aspergillus pseudodeflectus]|uniref:Uncharacterized protein n=1 Tax=Aspergillus pseudodeflectus TaxID=176178 RepID=A0ABR4KV18_9EURO
MFALATHYPKVERYGDAIRLLDELQTKLVQCPGLLTPRIEEVEENLAANKVAQEHHSTSNDTTELDGNLDGTHILWFDGAPPPGLLVPAATHTFK